MSDRKIIKQVQAIGQQENVGEFSNSESRSIDQHEMGFTDATSARPILWTQGMGLCVAIAVYNPQTKTAAMAHVDFMTEISSLAPLFQLSSGSGDALLEVHLVGGNQDSRADVAAVIKYIQSQNNALIKSANILSLNDGGKIAIDSRTGEIMTNFDPVGFSEQDFNALEAKLDKLTERCIEMQFQPFPIDCVYDGRSRKNMPKASAAGQSRLKPRNNAHKI